MRIAVCIPLSWNQVPKPFFLNCIRMMSYAQKTGYELIFCTNAGCYMDQCRDELVKQAQKHKPDYILFLDADQIYPDHTPEILMGHIKNNHLVVGGATPKRDNGFPLMYEFVYPKGKFKVRFIWKPLNRGLVEVDAMGMGGIMVHPEVFEKISPPRFKMWWAEDTESYVGEDIQFYKLLKEHNIQAWCDTDLKYGHLLTKPVVFNEKFNRKEK